MQSMHSSVRYLRKCGAYCLAQRECREDSGEIVRVHARGMKELKLMLRLTKSLQCLLWTEKVYDKSRGLLAI